MAKKKRARAREIALQALYQQETSSRGAKDIRDLADLEPFVVESTQDEVVRAYACQLIGGCLARRDELDQRIAEAATHWKLARIAPVDLAILRLALYEIIAIEEVPPKVAINEGIELAKKFSTEQSGSFVNGVLDRLYHDAAQPDPGTDDSAPDASPPPAPDSDQES